MAGASRPRRGANPPRQYDDVLTQIGVTNPALALSVG
jgi:hypothetical protein